MDDAGRGGLLVRVPYFLLADFSLPLFDAMDCPLRVVCTVAVETVEALLVAATLFRFALSGRPSHLLLTFGTKSGIFCVETPGKPAAVDRPAFWAASFCC